MKRDFTHENFEDFLKQNADNLRMKAPDKVWQNISGQLNKRKRRFGTGLSAFMMLTALLGYFTISNNTRQSWLTSRPSAQNNTEATPTIAATETAQGAGLADNPQTALSRQSTLRAVVIDGNDVEPTASFAPASQEGQSESIAKNEFVPTIVDSYPEETQLETETKQVLSKPGFLSATNASPWTIESAVNAYSQKNRKGKSRFQTQFHFTPTISYRKLSENKSYLRNTPAAPANYAVLSSSVNNMVTHKPDIGFELGVTEKFSLSQKVRIRAGLQFNVNRYDIKAFQAPFALATIALNNRRTARVDSLWTLSNYSNVEVNNNKGSWLQNFSFQVSAPVGVELALKGNDKMQFGIAGSVQPTYVLGDRAYMITSDYKSYSQVPWLLRRWNVNTAFETFVMYHTGKATWQVGPQVRYQLLSSFISNYPVKENLFDFGLKIGVSLNK